MLSIVLSEKEWFFNKIKYYSNILSVAFSEFE